MKIAITSTGQEKDVELDGRFGRCCYFSITDDVGEEWEFIKNEAQSQGSGAGIASSQFLSDLGVELVITGRVGPKAFRTLQASGIKIFTGASGSVEDALTQYHAGELKEEK
ncbi:MAG: NifB/NifX family molybdenum-iron cluster-binding protein [Halanaerobium sp.]|nr:NifB/NifX family molybdenum-iron cluster-binding protein [Halanaerobium sp.]